jgi:hypothetical protein
MRIPWTTAARWGAYGFFTGWFGLSVLQQCDKPELGRKVDPTSMAIPNWRFFAPTPARHDYNVLYRERLTDGTVTSWREQEIALARNLRQIMWHPNRRLEKALFDVASELFRLSRDIKDTSRIKLTVPYLSLLNYVSHKVDHHEGAVEVQFLIANSCGHDETVEPRMLFLSEWHALTGRKELVA